jgi:cell division septum initiation protein DivIVA
MSSPYEDYFEIREVYYDTMGKPIGHGNAAIAGEDRLEVDRYIELAKQALDKPILKFADTERSNNTKMLEDECAALRKQINELQ